MWDTLTSPRRKASVTSAAMVHVQAMVGMFHLDAGRAQQQQEKTPVRESFSFLFLLFFLCEIMDN
jgi:hypothetical protein